MMRLERFGSIYLYRHFTDLRKSISGLSVMVEAEMKLNPFDSALFIFTNRRRNLIKMLYWSRSGFCLWMKKLERDRFVWPKSVDNHEVITLSAERLRWLLDGYDIWKMKPFETLTYTRVS